MKPRAENVIVALDYESPEPAYRLVEHLSDAIQWYKVGPVLFTCHGGEVISFLQKHSKNVFLDLKLHDIPSIVATTVKQISRMGVQMATLHCLGGRKMLEESQKSSEGSSLKILGVTLLTSHSKQDLKDLGWNDEGQTLVGRLLAVALESGLSGIICSAEEAAEMRSRVPEDFLLVTPGIRLADIKVTSDDQSRIATPRQAFERGADYIVIGRPITTAQNPRLVVQNLFDT